jgi:hypothetical protein
MTVARAGPFPAITLSLISVLLSDHPPPLLFLCPFSSVSSPLCRAFPASPLMEFEAFISLEIHNASISHQICVITYIKRAACHSSVSSTLFTLLPLFALPSSASCCWCRARLLPPAIASLCHFARDLHTRIDSATPGSPARTACVRRGSRSPSPATSAAR